MSFGLFVIELLIFTVTVFLIYSVWKHYTTVNIGAIQLSSKTDEILKHRDKEIKKRAATRQRLDTLVSITKSIGFLQVSNRKMENLNYYAKRLNYTLAGNRLSGDDLFAIRACISLVYICFVLVLVVFNNLYFAVLLLLYNFPPMFMDFIIEGEIKDHNQLLLEDFRDFYAEFYYNYRHQSNRGVRVTEVAMRFYNRANAETRLLIDNLRADAIQSDEYALDQMKDLFRVTKIHRMADQVKMIIMGKTTNTDAMDAFKKEIEDEYRRKKRKELEWKQTKAFAVTGVAWIILTELVFLFGFSAIMLK